MRVDFNGFAEQQDRLVGLAVPTLFLRRQEIEVFVFRLFESAASSSATVGVAVPLG